MSSCRNLGVRTEIPTPVGATTIKMNALAENNKVNKGYVAFRKGRFQLSFLLERCKEKDGFGRLLLRRSCRSRIRRVAHNSFTVLGKLFGV